MLEKIISFLKNSEGYLSGEEISRNLLISRAGIWKYIQELRRQGYDIVAVPHLGYKLVSTPDKLFPCEIQYGLNTKHVGKNIIHLDTVESTMDEAFRRAMEGAAEGTVICCESQTKGRGRLGRSWSSPKGKGIYLSIILRPKISPAQASRLTPLCAVAACEAIYKFCGLRSQIKWPNDLLVDGKKLVGILTELSAETDQVKFVVVGMGVNVNLTPAQLLPKATSLKNELQRTFSRIDLTREILQTFEEWYERFQKEGFAPVIKRWKELTVTLGKRIRISDSHQSIEGKAIDIDEDGGLLIRNESGVIIKRMTGDVIQVS